MCPSLQHSRAPRAARQASAPHPGAGRSCGTRVASGQVRENLGRRGSLRFSHATRDDLRKLLETVLHRIAGGVELGVRARIIGLPRVEDALEAGALVAAERCNASHLDQIGNARAVFLLDKAIEFDEGAAQRTRETASQCRFARAAQSNERDTPPTIDRRILAGPALD